MTQPDKSREAFRIGPCPFCKSADVELDSHTLVNGKFASGNVFCNNCGACGPDCGTADRAISQWNALSDQSARDSQPAAVDVLDKPAQIGATIFREGVSSSAVIDRAQREYEYAKDPMIQRVLAGQPLPVSDDSRRGDVELPVGNIPRYGIDCEGYINAEDDGPLVYYADVQKHICMANPDAGKTGEAVAWIRGSGLEMLKSGDGTACVYRSEGMSNHSIPLYTAPPPSAADAMLIALKSARLHISGEALPTKVHTLKLIDAALAAQPLGDDV